MDGQRFDNLARVMARGTSRRKVLKGLAGGAFGGALLSLGVLRPSATGAQQCIDAGGTGCTDDSDCCQGQCSQDGVCFCSSPTNPTLACRCDSSDYCSTDGSLVCCTAGGGTGVCAPPNDACIEPCTSAGGTCSADSGCCQGLSCTDGTCAAACIALGDTCSDGDTCCDQGATCNQGTCNCGDPSEPQHLCPCDPSNQGSCGGGGLVCCASDSGGICTNASVGCEQPTCSDPGGSCSSDSDCCQGTCSDQGVCFCTDPSRPIIGCTCTTGTENPCGDSSAICCATDSTPGGPGICTSASVGCNPTGQCSDPGGSCSADSDCCQGTCSDQGVCFCEDPDRPVIGCACTTGTQDPCFGTSAVCCPSTDTPGGPGVCTSSMAECGPGPSPSPSPSPSSAPSSSPSPSPSSQPVTSLPNTGSGGDGHTGGILTSAALIAGGAAIAGHKLRKSRAEKEEAAE